MKKYYGMIITLFLLLATSIVHAERPDNIWLVHPWGSNGASHSINEIIITELEKKGWTVNDGRGALSLNGCAQQLNHVNSTDAPVVYVWEMRTYNNPEKECHHPIDIEDRFFSFWYGFTDFFSRVADKDIPPIDQATGVIRVGVDSPDYFGKEREEVLRSLAPNAEIILVRYFGRNEVLAGAAAGEIDYTWHSVEENSSNGLLITDYNDSPRAIGDIESISEKFEHIDYSQDLWTGLFYDNMDEELKNDFLESYLSVFETEKVKNIMSNINWAPPAEHPSDVSLDTIKNRLDW